MFLIDTSVWITLFRDKTENNRQILESIIKNQSIFLTRFTQMELLQGCRDEREWKLLTVYLEDQDYIEVNSLTWVAAARIYYDLQRQGLTVRSSIDCCIAQLTIDAQLTLIHNDRDFEIIQRIRPFSTIRFQP